MKEIKILNLEKINHSSNLIVAEIKKNFNFLCKRFFFIIGKKNEIRGNHAHKKQLQLIVCLTGSCQLDFDNGFEKKSILLNTNTIGIKVSAKTWGVQKYLEKNTILLVLSDSSYDEKDYIRDYKEFKNFIKNKY